MTPCSLFIQNALDCAFCSSKQQLPAPLLSRSLPRSLGSDRRSCSERIHASPLSECTAVYQHHHHHHQQETQERRKKRRLREREREREKFLFVLLSDFSQPPLFPPLPPSLFFSLFLSAFSGCPIFVANMLKNFSLLLVIDHEATRLRGMGEGKSMLLLCSSSVY
jgi:hypothetical protein